MVIIFIESLIMMRKRRLKKRMMMIANLIDISRRGKDHNPDDQICNSSEQNWLIY